MNARLKDLLWKAAAGILLWALCKNRKLMIHTAKKMISRLTVKELVILSFDIKDAFKNVKH